MLTLHISKMPDTALPTQIVPHAQVSMPEPIGALPGSRMFPIASPDALKTLQFPDQPGWKPLRMGRDIIARFPPRFIQTAFQAQETTELVQPVVTGLQPGHSYPFGTYVLQRPHQVGTEVKLLVRKQVQAQNMTRDRQIDGIGVVFAGPAGDQPGVIPFQQSGIFFRPVRCWERSGRI